MLAVAASGCGEDPVSVDDYAGDLCTALTDWTRELHDRQTELQEEATPDSTPQADRDALQRFVDGAVAASEGLVDDIEAAGEPDIEDGEEVAAAFREAAEDTRSELEAAQADVADIPIDSPASYRAAVADFVTEMRSALDGIDEHFEDVDAPELEMALDEASACQA